MLKKLFPTFILFSLFQISFAQILINEYSAANFDTHTDNYGEYEDWVELYNSGSTAVDLIGWALSDKVANPIKWVFPASFIIPAGEVAIIYCSSRDEINGGVAHTNFKITQTKGNEVFMLSDNTGILVDSVSVIPNQKSHTRGRETNGANNWKVFTTGTPNTNNSGAMEEYATTPVFSQNSGYYNAPINLTLSSPDPNVTIYYSLNGDEPNNTSNTYTGPIAINNTTVVKAVSYSSNPTVPPSFISYNTFFINDTHTIPILSISGDVGAGGLVDLLDGGWGSTGLEPQGTIEWFDKNGVLLDKGAGEFNKHGNDSWAYDQRGFDYIMRDQFGYNYAIQDKIFSTKNRDKFQRVILKAAANDNYSFEDGAHIRDAYCHHLSQLADLRMDERSASHCIVYLNGDYWGVYDIREKVDDHDFTDFYYDQDKNNIQYLKTWGGTWIEYGGPQAQTDWDNFVTFVTTNDMTIPANYNIVKSQYNTGSLIDYFLLNSYIVSSDWLNWNTSWWRGMDPNGDKKKWRYSLWDLDATFDHYINYSWPGGWQPTPTNDPCEPADLLNDPGGQGHVPIWRALLENEEFHDDFINRWQDLANGPFSCDFMINLLDSMIAVIDPEMNRQINTWAVGSYAGWQNNVQDMRNFILARCDSMNSAFIDCDTAITGIHDVSVEIIGIGEIEMSNNNIINNTNTPFFDQRFGGISLPFKVKSGSFYKWEIISPNTYSYDPFVDTLVIDLDTNVVVRAYFVPNRDIVYDVSPSGTNTSLIIDGNVFNAFPLKINYLLDDTVYISANIDPLYKFNYWNTDSVSLIQGSSITDSFYVTHYDTVRLVISEIQSDTATISGNDTLCSNEDKMAKVYVDFNAGSVPPYTFTFSIDGELQDSVITYDNPYIINTLEAGWYTLNSIKDLIDYGSLDGSAKVTVVDAPVADFKAHPDSMNILFTTTTIEDRSIGNIVKWKWDFGEEDNLYDYSSNPFYTYKDSVASYEIALMIEDDMGCKDTTYQIVTINNEYWVHIPNSFTPDNDNLNDRFCINYNGIREYSFAFNVYNRFSELVYSTNNIKDLSCANGWDGTHYASGKPLTSGYYIYEIYYQDFEGWKHKEMGGVTISK